MSGDAPTGPSEDRLPADRHSSALIAEAAAWVAHLHGSKRNADSDKGLQLWLKEDPARARVWEVATEVWDEVGNLRGAAIAQALKLNKRAWRASRQRTIFAITTAVVSAMAATLLIVAAGAFFLTRDSWVATRVGEQRTLALEDGSRVFLNTATRVVVRYDEHERRVVLESGEALFEVAKRPRRPFVVEAGDRKIHALGTAFVVRRDPHRLAVTLVEGKVAVSPLTAAEGPQPVDSSGAALVKGSSDPPAAPFVLTAGERVTFASREPPSMDRPELDKVTAWQHGQVVLDGARLQDAIAEMNRYNATELVLEHPQAAHLLVSGVFRAGDSLSFANAVAATYRLQVIENKGRIMLAGSPEAAYR